jgi:hypothetical protein
MSGNGTLWLRSAHEDIDESANECDSLRAMLGLMELLIIVVPIVLASIVVIVVLRVGSRRCAHCGQRIPKRAQFCHHCQGRQPRPGDRPET